jgi:hypothetical protein
MLPFCLPARLPAGWCCMPVELRRTPGSGAPHPPSPSPANSSARQLRPHCKVAGTCEAVLYSRTTVPQCVCSSTEVSLVPLRDTVCCGTLQRHAWKAEHMLREQLAHWHAGARDLKLKRTAS